MPDHETVSADEIAAAFGITGVDGDMLITALTHSTAALALGVPSFQRLEYLGDAVLELCVSRALFDMFPDAQEGALTEMRIAYVRRTALAEAAQALHMERYIRVAKAEKYIVEPDNPKVMADSLEAVIATVYLSQGFDAADKFIKRMFNNFEGAQKYTNAAAPTPDTVINGNTNVIAQTSIQNIQNWKSALQELIMHASVTEHRITPKYELISQKGPTHKPVFDVICRIGSKAAGHGIGSSKKQAEQYAAREAFLKITKKYTNATKDKKEEMQQTEA
jgi:ribonuclease-3